jgi:hypothetical protein
MKANIQIDIYTHVWNILLLLLLLLLLLSPDTFSTCPRQL